MYLLLRRHRVEGLELKNLIPFFIRSILFAALVTISLVYQAVKVEGFSLKLGMCCMLFNLSDIGPFIGAFQWDLQISSHLESVNVCFTNFVLVEFELSI